MLGKENPDKNYDSGESGSEFAVAYSDLKAKQKMNRIIFLWGKAFTRARSAYRINFIFS
jgi:hypothetical protein